MLFCSNQTLPGDDEICTFLKTSLPKDLPIKKYKISEPMRMIKINLKTKEEPGYDFITDRILKELPTTARNFYKLF